MTTAKAPPAEPAAEAPAAPRYNLESAAVQRSLQRLWQRYGKYAVSADEIRAELDARLGDRTLSAELHKMRGV